MAEIKFTGIASPLSNNNNNNYNNLLWSLFRGILQEHMWGTLSPILSLAFLVSQQSTMK